MSAVFPEPNAFTQELFEKLRRHPKRIVFSEGEDIRVVRVAAEMVRREIGIPILLGQRAKIEELAAREDLSLKFVKILNPVEAGDFKLFCDYYERAEAARGHRVTNIAETMTKPQNFGAMMVQYGQADGMVAGNAVSPAVVYRSAMQMIKPLQDSQHVFCATLLVSDLEHFGSSGLLLLGDTGLIGDPTAEELAFIAVETGKLARHVKGTAPRVAMLSHSTLGSMKTESSRKMQAATALAKQLVAENYLEMEVDGELEADVALNAARAEEHLQTQEKKPAADVLIFPNLDAANISMKLLQHVGGARKYGQLLMGLSRPVAQVARNTKEDTLLRAAAMIGVEAIKFNQMYLDDLI